MADAAKQEPVITMWSKEFTYDRWMKRRDPIHRGYLLKICVRSNWSGGKKRGCKSALSSCSGKKA